MDYLALLALMARMNMTTEEHDELFDDVQTMERSALQTMHAKE